VVGVHELGAALGELAAEPVTARPHATAHAVARLDDHHLLPGGPERVGAGQTGQARSHDHDARHGRRR
jgi:hypothetical protein